MSESLPAKDLVAHVLASSGKLSLAWLVERLVPVTELRALARKHGLVPKGFRVDKAPAKALAELLSDARSPKLLDEVCALLVTRVSAAAPETAPLGTPAQDLRPMLELKDKELAQVRVELERAQGHVARHRDKETDVARQLQQEQENTIRLRNELALAKKSAAVPSGATRGDVLERRVSDLERDLEDANTIEEALRRRMAEQQNRVAELSAEVLEIEQLLPKGKRRKAPPPPPPREPERVRVPHFTSAFYRSLEGKERRAVERAIQAVFLFCTEGPSYPGLEVKALEGHTLWSMRASLKLRVYFAMRPDGDIDVEALSDREDQHTTLRRLKER